MTPKQAIEILERHNRWRRCDKVPNSYEMEKPTELGIAIDVIVSKFKDKN